MLVRVVTGRNSIDIKSEGFSFQSLINAVYFTIKTTKQNPFQGCRDPRHLILTEPPSARPGSPCPRSFTLAGRERHGAEPSEPWE